VIERVRRRRAAHGRLEPHPLSKLVPPMSPEEFDALVDSVRDNGLIDPIITYEDKILDGRNREEACAVAGVEARFESLPEGQDPVAFVLAKNAHRRNLTAGRKAVMADRLANFSHGGDRKSGRGQDAEMQLDEVARLVAVSKRSIGTVRALKKAEQWELYRLVELGKITLNTAATLMEAADTRHYIPDVRYYPPQEAGPLPDAEIDDDPLRRPTREALVDAMRQEEIDVRVGHLEQIAEDWNSEMRDEERRAASRESRKPRRGRLSHQDKVARKIKKLLSLADKPPLPGEHPFRAALQQSPGLDSVELDALAKEIAQRIGQHQRSIIILKENAELLREFVEGTEEGDDDDPESTVH
jgi:hypothetical protein